MSSTEPPVAKSSKRSEIEPSGGSVEDTIDHLNKAPQDSAIYFKALVSEFDRVMANDVVAKTFYDMATVSYGLDERYGLMAALVALSNANRNLRDGRPVAHGNDTK